MRNHEIVPGIENHIIKSYIRSFLGYGSLNHSQLWHYVQPPVPLQSEISCQKLQSLLRHASLIIVELLQMRNMCSPQHCNLFHQNNMLDDALKKLKNNNYELAGDHPSRRVNVEPIVCLHEKFPNLWNQGMNISDIKKWSLRGQHWIDPPSKTHKQRAEWEDLVVSKKLYVFDDTKNICDCDDHSALVDAITLQTIKQLSDFKIEIEEQQPCMTPTNSQKKDNQPLTAETVTGEESVTVLQELDSSKKRPVDTSSALTIASDPRTWISFEVNNEGYGWQKVFVNGRVRQTKLNNRNKGAPGKPNKNFDNVQWCIPVCYETEEFEEDIWLPQELENIRNVETGAKRSKY